jgi:hypothetical protein
MPIGKIDQPTDADPRAMTPAAERFARSVDASATDRQAAVEPRRRHGPSPRRCRSTLAAAWAIAAAIGVGGGAISLALFSHAVPLAEPFAAGTIVLDATPTGTVVALGAMVPGDQVDGVLTVLNDGTDDLRYAMTSATTDPDGRHLADVLQLDVERRTGCSGAVLEVLYSGPIAGAAFGDPTPGSQAGDRQLFSGDTESICFRVTLPADTDTAYVSASTTATLTFWGEQVAGNP